MRQLERRIQKLEKKLGLGRPTYAERQLIARLEAARRRMAAWVGQDPPTLEAEPLEMSRARPKPFGNDLASRILRARDRFLREQGSHEHGNERDSRSGGAQ